jgi:hypothetical protein
MQYVFAPRSAVRPRFTHTHSFLSHTMALEVTQLATEASLFAFYLANTILGHHLSTGDYTRCSFVYCTPDGSCCGRILTLLLVHCSECSMQPVLYCWLPCHCLIRMFLLDSSFHFVHVLIYIVLLSIVLHRYVHMHTTVLLRCLATVLTNAESMLLVTALHWHCLLPVFQR